MTLRVNLDVLPADLPWIGGRMARELVDRLPAHGIDARINSSLAVWPYDLTYSLFVYGPPTRRPAVGLFTHGEARPRLFAKDYDGALTFSPTLAQWLDEAGAPRRARVLRYPVDPRFGRVEPPVFGVAGRTYSDGRKGEHLVAALVDAGYDVVAWGSGWPCRILSDKLDDLWDFYRCIDYFIDTSSDEGGCVPASEAMAMGVPVISHTVGVTLPVIPYERHDADSLLTVVRALTTPYTYEDFTLAHANYFNEVLA